MTATYGQVREQATNAAWARIRHLLYPETVHLLGVGDVADAIAVASDILAPAEHDALERLPGLLRELDMERRSHLRVVDERDEALQAADRLAYAVAALTGEDVGRRDALGNNPWQRALDILDRVAEANGRLRPSDLQYGKAA
jgi:hypothetical protein